jgi:predicted transposase YdaD
LLGFFCDFKEERRERGRMEGRQEGNNNNNNKKKQRRLFFQG